MTFVKRQDLKKNRPFCAIVGGPLLTLPGTGLAGAFCSPALNPHPEPCRGRYYYNRATGASEWVTGDKAQGERVGTPFRGEIKVERPPPPSLEEFLHRLFHEHDTDDRLPPRSTFFFLKIAQRARRRWRAVKGLLELFGS